MCQRERKAVEEIGKPLKKIFSDFSEIGKPLKKIFSDFSEIGKPLKKMTLGSKIAEHGSRIHVPRNMDLDGSMARDPHF